VRWGFFWQSALVAALGRARGLPWRDKGTCKGQSEQTKGFDMADPKILTISGSLRKGSFNRMLLNEAIKAFGPADVTEANLHLPLYDGDLEEAEGIPEAVQVLADQIKAADGIVISSPEYNKGVTGVIKNAFDWISRVPGGVLKGKPTVLMSANAGRSGGEAGQIMTHACLVPLQAHMLPGPLLAVANAGSEFTEEGTLPNERYQDALATKMKGLREAITG
jgi:chromate reductase